jgi:hypothetical protein
VIYLILWPILMFKTVAGVLLIKVIEVQIVLEFWVKDSNNNCFIYSLKHYIPFNCSAKTFFFFLGLALWKPLLPCKPYCLMTFVIRNVLGGNSLIIVFLKPVVKFVICPFKLVLVSFFSLLCLHLTGGYTFFSFIMNCQCWVVGKNCLLPDILFVGSLCGLHE